MNLTVKRQVLRQASLCAAALLVGGTAVAAPPPPQSSERIAILPVSGTNVHPGYLEAAKDILKDYLLTTGRFTVLSLSGAAGSSEIPVEQALVRGREAGADLVVVTHLTRLSGVGRLRLIAYRVSTGAVAHADRLGIAGGPDDLDPALKRLALGLATGQPVSKTKDIETVTQKEADPLLKETATKIFGLRVGAMVPFNRPAGREVEGVPGLGIFWLYDARSFLADVALDLHSNGDDATSFSVGIGGYLPLSKENFVPYIGLAAAFTFSDLGGAGANGLRLQPAIGLIFGRVSSVQFRGEIGYFFNTFGERDEASSYRPIGSDPPVTSEKRFAHGPQLSVGIGF